MPVSAYGLTADGSRSDRCQEALPLIAHGDQRRDTVVGRPERSVAYAAQLTPLRVPLTDPPGDRLAEITNLVDPREQGRERPCSRRKEGVFGMAELKKGS
jgi:hypothetical protein